MRTQERHDMRLKIGNAMSAELLKYFFQFKFHFFQRKLKARVQSELSVKVTE